MAQAKKEWFSEWFNSPYYHILYKHRDFEEAENFIDNLQKTLKFVEGQTALDLGCGRGRHAFYMHKKGLDVTGIDLSEENIAFASKSEDETLHFFVHDMRNVFAENHFDYIFNLFTSFGYFDEENDNIQAIKAASTALRKKGRMVLDFFNTEKVIRNLQQKNEAIIDGIQFKISRMVDEGWIIKDIRIKDGSSELHFQERVKGVKREEFENYFKFAGLKILNLYGNYQLQPFESESDRMIFILEKEN